MTRRRLAGGDVPANGIFGGKVSQIVEAMNGWRGGKRKPVTPARLVARQRSSFLPQRPVRTERHVMSLYPIRPPRPPGWGHSVREKPEEENGEKAKERNGGRKRGVAGARPNKGSQGGKAHVTVTVVEDFCWNHSCNCKPLATRCTVCKHAGCRRSKLVRV